MYSKITGDVCKSVFKTLNKIVDTKKIKSSHTGYKIPIKREVECVQSFLEAQTDYIEIGDFNDKKSQVSFSVELKLLFSETVNSGTVFINGFAYLSFPSTIEIHIGLNPNDRKTIFTELQHILRDLVRHEIEHLTQKGWNRKLGKKRNDNSYIRCKINKNSDIYYKYFLLADEVDANIHGLYSKAKSMKIPYKQVVNEYLNELCNDCIIEDKHKKIIYNKWKSRIKQICGLPEL
jgi:hypothetical protein